MAKKNWTRQDDDGAIKAIKALNETKSGLRRMKWLISISTSCSCRRRWRTMDENLFHFRLRVLSKLNCCLMIAEFPSTGFLSSENWDILRGRMTQSKRNLISWNCALSLILLECLQLSQYMCCSKKTKKSSLETTSLGGQHVTCARKNAKQSISRRIK